VPELLAGALADPTVLRRVARCDAVVVLGRVVLVGDAAYCASPAFGRWAELSLTGAYRLAGELAAAKGDHPGSPSGGTSRHIPELVRQQTTDRTETCGSWCQKSVRRVDA